MVVSTIVATVKTFMLARCCCRLSVVVYTLLAIESLLTGLVGVYLDSTLLGWCQGVTKWTQRILNSTVYFDTVHISCSSDVSA